MELKKFLKNGKYLLVIGIAIATLVTMTGCKKADDNKKEYNKENEIIAQNVSNNKSDNETNNTTANNITNNTQTGISNNPQNNSQSLIKDPSKGVIYNYVDDKKTWTETYNGRNYEIGYSYKIPYINIDSPDADNINKKIQDEYVEKYKSGKEYYEETR